MGHTHAGHLVVKSCVRRQRADRLCRCGTAAPLRGPGGSDLDIVGCAAGAGPVALIFTAHRSQGFDRSDLRLVCDRWGGSIQPDEDESSGERIRTLVLDVARQHPYIQHEARQIQAIRRTGRQVRGEAIGGARQQSTCAYRVASS